MTGRHRSDDNPVRLSPALRHLTACGAVVGILAPPVTAWAQTVAPEAVAPTTVAPPTSTWTPASLPTLPPLRISTPALTTAVTRAAVTADAPVVAVEPGTVAATTTTTAAASTTPVTTAPTATTAAPTTTTTPTTTAPPATTTPEEPTVTTTTTTTTASPTRGRHRQGQAT